MTDAIVIRVHRQGHDTEDHHLKRTKKINKIGTSMAAELRIDDPQAEPLHAAIEISPWAVMLIDMGTSAGTLLNGRKINKMEIKKNDRIVIGTTELLVVAGVPEATKATAKAAPRSGPVPTAAQPVAAQPVAAQPVAAQPAAAQPAAAQQAAAQPAAAQQAAAQQAAAHQAAAHQAAAHQAAAQQAAAQQAAAQQAAAHQAAAHQAAAHQAAAHQAAAQQAASSTPGKPRLKPAGAGYMRFGDEAPPPEEYDTDEKLSEDDPMLAKMRQHRQRNRMLVIAGIPLVLLAIAVFAYLASQPQKPTLPEQSNRYAQGRERAAEEVAAQALFDTSESRNPEQYIYHQVSTRQSLREIAFRYYGSLDLAYVLTEANQRAESATLSLTPPSEVRIPRYIEFKLQAGDTVDAIATRLFGDNDRADYIKRSNGFTDGTLPTQGTVLKIPLLTSEGGH